MPRARTIPESADATAQMILDDSRILWLPVRHFSPVCAHFVRAEIARVEPVAVLVEGPEDATPLIPHLIHPDTQPPVTLLSTWVDKRNQFGGGGVLNADARVPVRYRGWWPMVAWAPEYQALQMGHQVGADLAFIDTSLKASVPWSFVSQGRHTSAVQDRTRAEQAFYEALATRTEQRTFESFWRKHYELGAFRGEARAWFEALLTFAYCARQIHTDPRSMEADGTLPRERHMRSHIDAALKRHPEGRIAVVTGAFHTIALPWTRSRKATRADRATTTLLTAHSHRALAALYGQERMPAWKQAVWQGFQAGAATPHLDAARTLVVEVVHHARKAGQPVSTADAVAAQTAVEQLARLRALPEPGLEEVLDACQSTLVKGDVRTHGAGVEAATRTVLVGESQGRVTAAAGQPPLVRSFYEEARQLRLKLDGSSVVVRCDPAKQHAHREKSAFLHTCDFLNVPLFTALEGSRYRTDERAHFRGADLVAGTDMHLVAETWGLRWRETVDDRLVELADRGPTLRAVAESVLGDTLPGVQEDAEAAVGALLACAQMRLNSQMDTVLSVVERAVAVDLEVGHLIQALADLTLVHGYRDALDTRGDARVARVIAEVYRRVCVRLPDLGKTPDEQGPKTIDQLHTLARVATGFDAVSLDRVLLVEHLAEMAQDPQASPMVRGAGHGLLYGFGAIRRRGIAAEVRSYLHGSTVQVQAGVAYLDGLFSAARSIVLGRDSGLLDVLTQALVTLPWESFKQLLPDLRRAFTRFIPSELDAIAERVARAQAASETPLEVSNALQELIAQADERATS